MKPKAPPSSGSPQFSDKTSATMNPKSSDKTITGRRDEGKAALGKANGSSEFAGGVNGSKASVMNVKPLVVSVKGVGEQATGGNYDRLAKARESGNLEGL